MRGSGVVFETKGARLSLSKSKSKGKNKNENKSLIWRGRRDYRRRETRVGRNRWRKSKETRARSSVKRSCVTVRRVVRGSRTKQEPMTVVGSVKKCAEARAG